MRAEESGNYASDASARTAIRLAILTASLARSQSDYDAALSLLGVAADQGLDPASADFVRFLRPVIERMSAQQATLNAETARRRSLESQLEALKQIEERLNADDAGD